MNCQTLVDHPADGIAKRQIRRLTRQQEASTNGANHCGNVFA